MSRYDYEASKRIAAEDYPFYALIMAAYRQADSLNASKLESAWPTVVMELEARYNAPGGYLDGEETS